MAQRAYIADLNANETIEGVYAVQNCQLGTTRNGKPFIKCLLVDRTGRAPGRMWSATEALFQQLPTDGFVRISGQTQPYQGEMQIIIQHIEAVTPSSDELIDLLPSTDRDIDTMFQHVLRLLDTIEHPGLKALIATYTSDADLMAKFKHAPAAAQLHHAYLGGLLEHTLSMMKLGDAIAPMYPEVDRALVLAGLFLHDLGKCEEMTWETGFGYSDQGHLVGHIARGVVWLNEKVRACRERQIEIEPELVWVLEHVILSHHGQPEFGALKIPATPEAILISLIDNLDARMQMVNQAAQRDSDHNTALGGNFTEKIWALGTRVYRPNPLESQETHTIVDDPELNQVMDQLQFGQDGNGRGGI